MAEEEEMEIKYPRRIEIQPLSRRSCDIV